MSSRVTAFVEVERTLRCLQKKKPNVGNEHRSVLSVLTARHCSKRVVYAVIIGTSFDDSSASYSPMQQPKSLITLALESQNTLDWIKKLSLINSYVLR